MPALTPAAASMTSKMVTLSALKTRLPPPSRIVASCACAVSSPFSCVHRSGDASSCRRAPVQFASAIHAPGLLAGTKGGDAAAARRGAAAARSSRARSCCPARGPCGARHLRVSCAPRQRQRHRRARQHAAAASGAPARRSPTARPRRGLAATPQESGALLRAATSARGTRVSRR